jgi:hypothetical protein
MSAPREKIQKLALLAKRTNRRLAAAKALERVAIWLPVPLMYALAALTYIKVVRPGADQEQFLLLGGVVATLVVLGIAVFTFFSKRSATAGSLALDNHHQLEDRVTNALSFAREKHPSPLMVMAMDDALAFSSKLSPRRAAPIRVPKEFAVSALLALSVYGISLLEVRTTRVEVLPQAHIKPLELASDDVELLQAVAAQLEKDTQNPETLAAVRRFNQLIEDVAERRLDRREIFQRLEQLENELNQAAEGEAEALNEGLDGLAEQLRKSKLTEPIAKAFEEKNLPDAEEAMRKLAEQLKKQQPTVDRAELDRLRKALEAASQSAEQRLERLEAQRRELEQEKQRLLNKRKPGEQPSAADQQQQQSNDRKLKRLDRQKKQSERAKQALSQLDKELAKAASELMKEMGEAAKSVESAAENVNRMAEKQLSEKEKHALKKQLEEMRELLRQAKQGGKQREELLERFRQMARGGKPSGDSGESKPGDGKPGSGKRPGQLKLGGTSAGPGIEIPIPGQGPGNASGSDPGTGSGQDGKQWGAGSDPNLTGEATDPKGQVQDVAAAGVDSGEGSASTEVVYGAAERGFVGRGYQRVYTEYKTVAEEVMETDEIPPGYKFYVRRYFQLIRPRD